MCVHCSSIIKLLFHTQISNLFCETFSRKLPIMTCCTCGNLKIRTLKPSRFKNQSSDTLKLLDQNGNHQDGFIKQKIVALHHCGFKLDTVIVITIINEIVVTGD